MWQQKKLLIKSGEKMALIAHPQRQTQKFQRSLLSTRQHVFEGSKKIKKWASDNEVLEDSSDENKCEENYSIDLNIWGEIKK